MPLRFACRCGQTFETTVDNAGGRTTCPTCGIELLIPVSATLPVARRLPEKPVESGFTVVEDEDEPVVARVRLNEVVEDESEVSPKKRKKKKRRTPSLEFDEPEEFPPWYTNASVIGGALMILLGLLWLAVSPPNDIRIIRPFGLMAAGAGWILLYFNTGGARGY
jgi:hypothetical protein